MNKPKYPEIVVELSEQDGNAFTILGAVKKALKQNNISQDEINQFFTEATAGDYDHLLQTAMKWVTVE